MSNTLIMDTETQEHMITCCVHNHVEGIETDDNK